MRPQIIISAYVKFDNIQVVFSRTERWIWAHIHKESFSFFSKIFSYLNLLVLAKSNCKFEFINILY